MLKFYRQARGCYSDFRDKEKTKRNSNNKRAEVNSACMLSAGQERQARSKASSRASTLSCLSFFSIQRNHLPTFLSAYPLTAYANPHSFTYLIMLLQSLLATTLALTSFVAADSNMQRFKRGAPTYLHSLHSA